ncbi:hypothetical protein [Daejeonella sp.]|uniref:beta strand repeat-containing protein n=1 Tax=Daejeonella sp. TaxID=2805397 RepID=UPI00272F51C3|nr:hypothetical protein [Daejeonella sp.]MDP2413455.1 hypothetical protein [Daejeonella sp.]
MRPVKLLSIALMLTGIFFLGKATAQIKIGTNGANIQPSSLLELESANQGFLLPRMANTIAIDALNPPNGMMIYRTTDPAGLYIRKNNQWEYITGSMNGDAIFNSVTVNGPVTALSFSGPLTGNASTATLATTATNSNNSAVTNDISNPGTTYPVFVNSTPGNQPLRTSSGNLSYVPATGILTARGFNGLLTGDVIGNASSSVDAQNTVNIRITDNPTNPATVYPTLVSGISGPLAPSVASTKLSFVPLTGELNATTFRGALIGNASSATSVTGNVAAVNGGTGQSIFSPGDMLYASTSTSLVKLPIGTPGTVLRVSAGNVPNWSTAGAGTVINVTGTPNRITVTDPTVSPVLDIATTYPGQASISTLGTITAGTWNATEVGVAYGGTGRTSLAAGRVLVGNGTGIVNSVDGDVPNLVLTSNGPGLAPTFKSPGAGDMVLNVDQTITGIKTFGAAGNVGKLVLAGNTSGTTILNGPSAGLGGTVILPLTGTLATLAGTETLSNKTLTSPTLTNPSIGAAVGTTLVLGGGTPLGTTNQTGTGRIVMDNTPTLITPNIGVATGTSLNLGGGTVTAATFSGTANDVNNVNGIAASTVQAGSALANSSTANNDAGTIVRRDGTGNFSAGTITANLTGTASNATLAANATTATSATNTNITDDNTTATDIYPTFVTGTSGNNGQRVNSVKLTYRPSTGMLNATGMRASQFTSTATLGTPPFVVASATPVATLSIGGNAATATRLAANVDIYGSTFDGFSSIAGPVAGQFGGTGVANTGRTITLATNLVTTGAGVITLNSAAGSTVTLPASGTLYGTQVGTITSASLGTSLSDETGTGVAVLSIDPRLVKPVASSLLGDGAYLATKGPVGVGVGLATAVAGTNLAGTVTIVMTGAGTTSNKLIEVTYSEAFPAGSFPVLYPANPAAAELSGTSQVYAQGFTNRFEITSGSGTGLANGATYIWNYHVIGR